MTTTSIFLCGSVPPGGKLVKQGSAATPRKRALARDNELARVERLGIGERVCFTGWAEEADKPALYAMAMGSVFVSEVEGYGLPVIEAMASGCPLVAGGG